MKQLTLIDRKWLSGRQDLDMLQLLASAETDKPGLCSNHETLNTQGSFRYVTKEGVQDFIVWKALEDIAKGMKVCSQNLRLSACLTLRLALTPIIP